MALAEPLPGFEFSPDPPTAGVAVTFTAEDTCAEPVTCSWDFGDGTAGATGASVEHVYAEPGPVSASLTTDDPTDELAPVTTSRSLDVQPAAAPNRPPVADVSASPTSPGKGETVQFDSTASSDPDGDPLAREWDLDGDGSFETGDVSQPFRSYAVTGTVTVSLRVTDPQGESAVDTVTLRVVNRPPTVSIAPAAPLSNEDVTFTATAADPDGSIASYAWDLDGDGSFDDGSGATATTRYALPGPRTVRVRVTDDDGAVGQDALAITVGNRAPTATFTYSPDAVLRGDLIVFRASAADPDGTIASYAWDLDGDGIYETSGAAVERQFPVSQSEIHVSLLVTDNFGASAETSAVIVPGNLLPTATVTASEPTPLVGEPVLFTADAVDPDGVAPLAYAWDLDGDGDFDDGTGSTASVAFTSPGPAVVRLKVTDADDASVTVSHEVVVQARPATASAAGTPPAGEVSGGVAPSAPVLAATVAPVRLLTPFPIVRFAGALNASGARFTLFTVTAPRGSRILVRCHGKGCPRDQALRATGVTRLAALQRPYRAGVRLVVRVTRRGRIGKYVHITIRKGKPPARRDACVWPGKRTPRPCPRPGSG